MVEAYDGLAESILTKAITAEVEEGRQTVTMFTQGVEQNVQEQLGILQEEYGSGARAVGSEAMAKAQSYIATKCSLLDPSYEVEHTEEQGAAAWYEPGTGRTAFSFHAMDPDANEGYWARTRRHEEVHQGQALAYNSGTLVVDGEAFAVFPVLIEGQATQGQPASDLTPAYLQYQQTYQRLASVLGSRAPLDAALRSGDILGLQQRIIEKEIQSGRGIPAGYVGHL